MRILRPDTPLCTEDVRRKYRRAALRTHPDKGGSAETFQRVCDAHDVLQKAAGTSQAAERDYGALLRDFLMAAFASSTECRRAMESLASIAAGCKRAADSLAQGGFSQSALERVLAFLEKHAAALRVSTDDIKAVKDAFRVREADRAPPMYTLTASLEHIMEGQVYRLFHNGKEFMVPLWHEDMTFPSEDGDVTVRCKADLPPNTQIDEFNDLHVHMKATVNDILESGVLSVRLGARSERIQSDRLRVARRQVYRIRRRGPPRIDLQDVYRVSDRADVVVHLELC